MFSFDAEIQEDSLELEDIRSAMEEMQPATETGEEAEVLDIDYGLHAGTSVQTSTTPKFQTDSAPVSESVPAAAQVGKNLPRSEVSSAITQPSSLRC